MEEALFYGLFFVVILFNYVMKLKIEKRGEVEVKRSNLREGAVLGVCIYLLHQTLTHPEISVPAKVIDTALALACILAAVLFFIKGRHSGRTDDLREDR